MGWSAGGAGMWVELSRSCGVKIICGCPTAAGTAAPLLCVYPSSGMCSASGGGGRIHIYSQVWKFNLSIRYKQPGVRAALVENLENQTQTNVTWISQQEGNRPDQTRPAVTLTLTLTLTWVLPYLSPILKFPAAPLRRRREDTFSSSLANDTMINP